MTPQAAPISLVGFSGGQDPFEAVQLASRSFDAVSVFASDLGTARRGLRVMVGPDPGDPLSRSWPNGVRLALREHPRVAVPRPENLDVLVPGYRQAFERFVEGLPTRGMDVDVVDVSALLETARLLYDGTLVAERYAAVGAFLDRSPADVDPTVSAVIRGAALLTAHGYVRDREKVDLARVVTSDLLHGVDALVLPTTTEHPTIADVRADPLGVNRRLGTYTNFVNLLDMAAVAVPVGTVDGLPFGVQLITRAFDDQLGLDLAARLSENEPWPPASPSVVDAGVDLIVFGAHLRGQPLNRQLQDLGARFGGVVRTSPSYALKALNTTPAKPGLVRVGAGAGVSIEGERWRLSHSALGGFLTTLPFPMALGQVELLDGSWSLGFGCSHDAAEAGTDISGHGSWRAFVATQ